MPGSPRSLEPRNHVARHALFDDGVDRDPLRIAELRNGRRVERGKHREHGFKIGALDVEHQAHLRLRVDGAAQHERDLIDLLALPRVGERGLAGDEMRLALHHRVDDLEVVGLAAKLPVSVTSTMASASMGGLTSVAPQLNSTLTLTPSPAK